jgi:hypothetical protein
MGYTRLYHYRISCDGAECTSTDMIISERELPVPSKGNPVPEGWRKFRDTETGEFGTFCPKCSGAFQSRPDVSGLEPLGGCPHCRALVYRTPSGLACENGHGGWVREELAQLFDHLPESKPFAPEPFTEGANAEPFQTLAREAFAEHTAEVLLAASAAGFEVVADSEPSTTEAFVAEHFPGLGLPPCTHASQHRDALERLVCSLCGATWTAENRWEVLPAGVTLPGPDYLPAWDQSDGVSDEDDAPELDSSFFAEATLTSPGEDLIQPAPDEPTVTQVLPEGALVYALLSDGRLLQKKFHDSSCAKVAAQQVLDLQLEPQKMLAWYEWQVVDENEAP